MTGDTAASALSLQVEPAGQPFLFSPQTMERITEAERRGEYTLERLKEVRPEVIPEIIELRGQLTGMLRIAKMLGVHHKTVAAVDAAYPQAVDEVRQRVVRKMRSASEKLVEQIEESPESVPWNVKGLVVSQLLDKAELLEGRATARVENIERVDIYGDWDVFVRQLIPEGNANAIDIDSVKVLGIHSEVGEKSAIRDSNEEAAIAVLSDQISPSGDD